MEGLTLGEITYSMMINNATENRIKYYLTGYITEPLLVTTGVNGFDYHFAYQFKDEDNKEYILRKKEAHLLAINNMVHNATFENGGFKGVGIDLRKLPQVVVDYNKYLTDGEKQTLGGKLKYIEEYLNHGKK